MRECCKGNEQVIVNSQKSEYVKQTVDFKLYLITDRKLFTNNHSLFTVLEEALKGGVRAIQLREKDLGVRELLDMAYKLRDLTKRHKARLFINDRVDVAIAVEADGVHLGQKSIPAHAAKKVSNKLVVGVSAHSMEEAVNAERDGADFITFGPVYKTPSKLRYGEPVGIEALRDICSKTNVPVFAIGGIKPEKSREVLDCGAYGIAAISAVFGSKDIKGTAERFLRELR